MEGGNRVARHTAQTDKTMRITISHLPVHAIVLGVVWALGCTPKVAPNGPGTEPNAEKPIVRPTAKVTAPARQVLVGEMCPEGAAGPMGAPGRRGPRGARR